MGQIRGVLSLLTTLGIVVTLSGYFGHIHPGFDSVAAFRLQAVAAFALAFVLAVAFGALVTRALALTGLLVAGAGLVPSLLPGQTVMDPDLIIYSQNLRFDNHEIAELATAIRAEGADVVLLQEVAEANRDLMILLESEYPSQVYCPFSTIGGVAIVAKNPIWGAPGCERGQGMAWATLRLPGAQSVTVVSLHLAWPWPHGQPSHAARIAGIAKDLPHPLLIAGDFNMAPWGHSVRSIAEASGTRVLGGLHPTFHQPSIWPGLPLDHVLASPEIEAETSMLAKFGSDHTALRTKMRLY